MAKRKLKEASEETQSEFRRTQVGPRVPRCAPREAKLPPESAKMEPKEASGQPLGHQDGQRGRQKEPKVTKMSSKMRNEKC